MAFSDNVRTLANQVMERRAYVQTEEATKQALILPFFGVLGYDIYNPAEIIPEYKAGWAKATEKIDYALNVSGKLSLFVEAKGPNEVLTNHDPQLAKYFNSTPDVKFAIITNGIQYRFFTDLQERNLLDKKPFFEFNIEDFSEADIVVLEKFRKEVFNADKLVGFAEDLVFLSALKGGFKSLLRDPSDDFVRFAVSATNLIDGRITQKVVDRFKPLVKESISAAILEIVGQSFLPQSTMLGNGTSGEEAPAGQNGEQEPDTGGHVIEVLTTEEELAAFELIAHMVAEYLPEPDKLRHKDTLSYFTVYYAKITGWFARFFVQDREKKAVCLRLPVDKVRELAPGFEVEEAPASLGQSRMYFNSVEELRPLQELFIVAVREVIS